LQTSNKLINIGIAGYGFGRKVHLTALRESLTLNPLYFYHPNKEKCSDIEKETDLMCFSKWDELINDKKIDGVIIATPPEFRYKLAKEALSNRKHILLEKPVALKCKEIKELQVLALKNNLSVCVDFEYRGVPLFLQTKKILNDYLLGEIYLIKLDWLMGSRADPDREWNWYSLKDKGGGVIGALGTHAFDMLNWFFGEIKKVNGKLSTSIKNRPNTISGKNCEVTSEDVCLANIEINNFKQTATPCQVSLSSVSKGGRGFSLEVYGSKGSLFLTSNNQKDYVHGFNLTIVDNLNNVKAISADARFEFDKTWSDGRIAPVKYIHNLWSESIKNKTPVIPGLHEGLQSQKVCEALRFSSETGIAVEL
tara:strand:- start:364 stop:1461 length:1098 start_codon:yes stop_codon:yes gene_type:complete